MVLDGLDNSIITNYFEGKNPLLILPFTSQIEKYMIKYMRSGDTMLKMKDILDEKDKRLRLVSKEVEFPLTEKDIENINLMEEYLVNSQIEEKAEEYDLRPGMGMAAVQIGVLKRIFVIVDEYEEGKFKNYVVINPEIRSMSEELVYVGEGEGCLSINRDVEGIVPRHARITVNAYDEEGNPYTIRVREEIALAFQHEIDHLDGILFPDRIDKKNPFKDAELMRER